MANYYFNPEPLACGGEKAVHVGECADTGMPVVLKFLLQPYSRGDFDRFAAEISRLRAAQSHGVARLIDYNLEWIPPFFVEEYFPQGTLAEHMMEYFRAGYVFDEAQALGFITQILESLAEVHGRNIIHRDIKPSNIMMANGQLVITDMGLGRTLNRATRLQTRAFMGTKFYAAPEQEMGTGGVDHRSDLYAVGVILHELLTGERGAYNRQIYGGDPAIRTIIKQLLMFDKRQRYASAKQVLGLVRQSMMAPQQPFWM